MQRQSVQVRGKRALARWFAAALVTAATFTAIPAAADAAVTFQPAVGYTASGPWSVVTGDLNADGAPDVATASITTNIVSALLGNGAGALGAPLNTAMAPNNLMALAAADLNGDGKGDLAAAQNGSSGSLRIYLGNGDGTFASGVNYAVGNFPQDVAIGRINSDAAPDIVVANQATHNVHIFLNNGAGVFSAAPGSPLVDPGGSDVLGVAIADFDRDGDGDLALAGINAAAGVSVFNGNGTGTFAARPTPPRAAGVQSFVVGDLNGDGFPDIAGSRPATGDVAIITNDASGLQPATFVDPDGAGGNNGRVAIADLDGDAVLDLAVPYVSGTQADKIAILIGRGDATFESSSFAPVGSGPRQVAAADLNRDGNQDLVSANSGAGNVSVLLATPPSVTVTGSIDFGAQAPGTSSAQQLITVRNDGPQRLRPASVTLGGSDAAAFTLSADGCTGANLPVGGSCTVGVGFTPTTVGPRSATVAIATNGAGTPHVVQLTGSGAEPTVPPGGGLLPGGCANEKSGTAAADVLTGTELGDNLIGLDGNDKLTGLAGDDCLAGGDDNDELVGGDGADKLNGGKGNDRLKGNAGKNKYKGGSGDDKIKAANGVLEKVNCGRGDDRATVDRKDKARHCEKVTRKRP